MKKNNYKYFQNKKLIIGILISLCIIVSSISIGFGIRHLQMKMNVEQNVYEPYSDVTMLQYSTDHDDYKNLSDYQRWGVKHITAAFMQQDMSGDHENIPYATWGGNIGNDNAKEQYDYINNSIMGYEKSRGKVTISMGGASGTPIWATKNATPENVAADIERIANQYYGKYLSEAHSIDFDIEGTFVSQLDATQILGKACKIVNQSTNVTNHNLNFILTLPVLPTGLTNDGFNTVNVFKENYNKNFRINLMCMDYGDWVANGNEMGQEAINSVTYTAKKVAPIFNVSVKELYSKYLGATPMIGVNDVTTEVFTFSDTEKFSKWARGVNLHSVGIWSLGRDFPSKYTYVSATASSYPKQKEDGEFSKTFLKYLS